MSESASSANHELSQKAVHECNELARPLMDFQLSSTPRQAALLAMNALARVPMHKSKPKRPKADLERKRKFFRWDYEETLRLQQLLDKAEQKFHVSLGNRTFRVRQDFGLGPVARRVL